MDARPDQEEMEQAINKFLLLLEEHEKKGFKDLATPLSRRCDSWPACTRFACFMSAAEAMEAGLLSALDEDQAEMFTPSELRL